MNLVRTTAGFGLAAMLLVSVSACSNSGSSSTDTSQSAAPAATAAMAGGSMSGAMTKPTDMGKDTMVSGTMHGRFGGPVYTGAPALNVTAALVMAGGGPAKYSTATALTTMLGKATVSAEVAKLSKQYGGAAVNQWLKTFDFAVNDSLKIATAKGIKLPAADPKLTGKKLASTLVSAGTDADGVFQIEFLLDKAVSHGIHVQVMNDIDKAAGFGKKVDLDYHTISNQAFYDVGEALGMTVKLAPLH
ncbi:MAG TPA: hypothetical protein VJN22_02915 [Candidatus Eremiobacteraceae bacterium]|nr:hypothetical protein [Candidatus Eremiobacteraceae bacterium]